MRVEILILGMRYLVGVVEWIELTIDLEGSEGDESRNSKRSSLCRRLIGG
jgi:hypothetical protein